MIGKTYLICILQELLWNFICNAKWPSIPYVQVVTVYIPCQILLLYPYIVLEEDLKYYTGVSVHPL
jgi:hypothetical protein